MSRMGLAVGGVPLEFHALDDGEQDGVLRERGVPRRS